LKMTSVITTYRKRKERRIGAIRIPSPLRGSGQKKKKEERLRQRGCGKTPPRIVTLWRHAGEAIPVATPTNRAAFDEEKWCRRTTRENLRHRGGGIIKCKCKRVLRPGPHVTQRRTKHFQQKLEQKGCWEMRKPISVKVRSLSVSGEKERLFCNEKATMPIKGKGRSRWSFARGGKKTDSSCAQVDLSGKKRFSRGGGRGRGEILND